MWPDTINKQLIFYKKFSFVETGGKGVFDEAAKLSSGKLILEIELVKLSSKKQLLTIA